MKTYLLTRMLPGKFWLSVGVIVSLQNNVFSDVIVETVKDFKPQRIYEDAPAR